VKNYHNFLRNAVYPTVLASHFVKRIQYPTSGIRITIIEILSRQTDHCIHIQSDWTNCISCLINCWRISKHTWETTIFSTFNLGLCTLCQQNIWI